MLSACGQKDWGVVWIEPVRPAGAAEQSFAPICSKLNFYNYSWPQNTFSFEIEAFKLALNISSSFEGVHDWRNLANDFDGQGLSMGLLNQTLGTGSLQPMLIKFKNLHGALLQKLFSRVHYNSLLGMLKRWEGLKSNEEPISPLDQEADYYVQAATSDSVKWAQKNLYDKHGDFIPSWKKELENLLSSTEFVNIQIEAAWTLHKKSVYLFNQMGVPELRSYLLMFDFVVQNGNIYMRDWDDYQDFLNKNQTATSTERLETLLDLRLRHVKPQYVGDVRLRKLSIIYGQGRVHGVDREYEKEFCFDNLMPFVSH